MVASEEQDEPELLGIRDLVARVSVLLSRGEIDQHSGRVSEVPSVRTVRYYASHGLLDPPIAHQGRKALYGERHVLQLLAIKRLQSRGLSLVEVQARLLGSSDEELTELAGVELLVPRARLAEEQPFWAREPGDVPVPQEARGDPGAPPGGEDILAGLRLAPGVLLLLEDPQRALEPEDRRAIQSAAEPLLRLLEARRLREPDE